MNPAATLHGSDFWRFPTQQLTRSQPFKEWHHFVVQTDEARILVNFSLLSEDHIGCHRRVTPQTVVIVHGQTQRAALDRPDGGTFRLSPDLRSIAIGESHMHITPAGYHVVLKVDDGRIAGELELTPRSRPFVVNNQPVGSGRLSWLFVPRLRCTGTMTVDGATYRIHDEVAYHDHNWGHFRWGDDFSWMWGSVLPVDDDDWTLVTMRMTDQRVHRTLAQALYVWRGDEPAAMWRDSRVRVDADGAFAHAAAHHLPPVTAMLSTASSGVPEELSVHATQDDDHITLRFRPEDFTRIGFPDELSTDRLCSLDESSGLVSFEGTIGGETIERSGRGFFEFCNG